MKAYAGIGARDGVPDFIIQHMEMLAQQFASQGIILRSGAARGSDSAFERGCDHAHGPKQIFLPHLGFNSHSSTLTPPQAAFDLIDSMWSDVKHRSSHVRQLFARNCQQILGPNLDDPSDLVICWTRDGKAIGGTGRAIQVANKFSIPVVNLYLGVVQLELYDF
jgi:hypothetical protein